ncbi:MAG: dCTP deaminase [Acidobacteria bacterium]|nr:dCTP deaminase [Acidobacteriota bacterium]
MVLSDKTIKEEIARKRIIIDPLDVRDIQPASVDVHLDNKILVFRNSRKPYIDIRQDTTDLTELQIIEDDQPFILHPGEFVLASTLENIQVPDDIVGRLEGKSSLGRIGLLIHSTAGYVDPGWKGHLTLELSNPEVKMEVDENLKKILDSILILLSSKTFEQVISVQGKFRLKDEIITRVNRFLVLGHIKNVYFSEFIIQ